MPFNTGETLDHPYNASNVKNDSSVPGDSVADALDNGGGGGFTPSEDTDWAVVPTTVQEALDELAERVEALENP